MRLFAPEAPPEGCASGECLPGEDAGGAPQREPTKAPPVEAKAPPSSDEALWRATVEAVRRDVPRLGASLSHARFLGTTPDSVRIAFNQSAAFHRATIFGLSRVTLEQAIASVFGRRLKLEEETNAAALDAAPSKSIAEEENTVRQTRERTIEARVREHPAVRDLARVLGGRVEHIQVLEPAPREAPVPLAADDDP